MLTRRAFLGSTAAFALAGKAAPLREFAYSHVRLTEGPVAAMYRRLQAHYLKLDEDRLLKVYRQRVGMPAPGRDMGGWYDAEGFVPGHLIGQFISGLSRLYACTGDPEARAKARRLTLGYAETFDRDGNPYASPKASATWACYVLDKYEIGLLDAAALAEIAEARTLLPRVIEGAMRFIPDHTFDRIGVHNPPYDEPYVLPENLFQTSALTGDRRYFDLAKRYLLDRDFFDPLANGDNVLPGRHGYSHVIALSSAAKAYQTLGEEKYLRAIRNGWDMIEQAQQYASGAWAANETFVRPRSGELAATLTRTRDHFETPCCFYAWAKVARYLTTFTGEAKYGDGLERALFNTILGALDPDDDGGYFYYSDYQSKAHKTYYKQKWPCCAGTLLQSVADFPLNLYFQDARGVYVNLYAGSELRWKQNGVPVRITQRTAYPESEQIVIQVDPESPVEFSIRLRIPAWLDKPAPMEVNGKPAGGNAGRGAWAALSRRWHKGDTIELRLPFSTRFVPIDETAPNTVAVMRGPLMLTAVDPPDDFTISASQIATMRPFYLLGRETYSTYFQRVRA